MKKEMYKKFITAGVVLLLLATVFGVAAPNLQSKESQNTNFRTDVSSLDEESKFVKFAVEFKPRNQIIYEDGDNKKKNCVVRSNDDMKCLRYETELTVSEANHLEREFMILDNKISTTKNPEERMDLYKSKLYLLRESGILPESFTLENLSEISAAIGRGLYGNYNGVSNSNGEIIEDDDVKYGLDLPYMGIGTQLTTISPFGSTFTFGVSGEGIGGVPIGKLQILQIHTNKTGIHIIPVQGAIAGLFERDIPINNPLWSDLFGEYWRNESLQFGMAFYLGQVLIGFSLSAGYINSIFALPPPAKRVVAGNFFSIWMASLPISITLYRMYPQPPAVWMDIGITTGLVGVFIPGWVYTDYMDGQ
jgi:hypothetical protein